jgi:hypothetical protein
MQILQNNAPPMTFCNPLVNNICEAVKHNMPIAITVFNINSHPMNTSIRIPSFNRSILVQNEKLDQIQSDVMKGFYAHQQMSIKETTPPYQVQFEAELPPLGYRTYFLTALSSRLA